MQIFVNSHNKTEIITAEDNSSIKNLQNLLKLQENTFLMFAGRILSSKLSFSDYGISNNSTITVTNRCLGGAMTETDKAALLQRLKKKVCRICYATNSLRATNCRKKHKCGGSSKLRPKKDKKSTKKSN